MSVTVVNDWRFSEKGKLEQGMAAIREYMDYLSNDEPELEQSLWLQTHGEPLRYFHIATYRTNEALERQRKSDGTMRFVEKLYPLIDQDSVVQPVGDVVANTGKGPGEI